MRRATGGMRRHCNEHSAAVRKKNITSIKHVWGNCGGTDTGSASFFTSIFRVYIHNEYNGKRFRWDAGNLSQFWMVMWRCLKPRGLFQFEIYKVLSSFQGIASEKMDWFGKCLIKIDNNSHMLKNTRKATKMRIWLAAHLHPVIVCGCDVIAFIFCATTFRTKFQYAVAIKAKCFLMRLVNWITMCGSSTTVTENEILSELLLARAPKMYYLSLELAAR